MKSKIFRAAKAAGLAYPVGTRFEFDGTKMIPRAQKDAKGQINPEWEKARYELILGDGATFNFGPPPE